jgi:hypothetical protein
MVDVHIAGYKVILMILFVICHDKQREVGGMADECQKDEGGLRRNNSSKEK